MRSNVTTVGLLGSLVLLVVMACGGGSASIGDAQQVPTELIGSWPLVSSNQLVNNDQVIHFHDDGSLTVETVAIFWNIEELGEYSRAPDGGVRIKVFNEFGFAYIDDDYEVTIAGDELRLTTLSGLGDIQEWIRVK